MAFPLPFPAMVWFGSLWPCLGTCEHPSVAGILFPKRLSKTFKEEPGPRCPSSYKKSRRQSRTFPEPLSIQQWREITSKPGSCSFVFPVAAPTPECLEWEVKLTMRNDPKLWLPWLINPPAFPQPILPPAAFGSFSGWEGDFHFPAPVKLWARRFELCLSQPWCDSPQFISIPEVLGLFLSWLFTRANPALANTTAPAPFLLKVSRNSVMIKI